MVDPVVDPIPIVDPMPMVEPIPTPVYRGYFLLFLTFLESLRHLVLVLQDVLPDYCPPSSADPHRFVQVHGRHVVENLGVHIPA